MAAAAAAAASSERARDVVWRRSVKTALGLSIGLGRTGRGMPKVAQSHRFFPFLKAACWNLDI
jgi:hypothetical protein